MRSNQRFYSIHGIVAFSICERTSILHRYFSRLGSAYDNFAVDDAGPLDLVIEVGSFAKSNDDCRVVDERFHVKRDYLFCGADSHKFAKWAVEITGFEGQQTLIRICPNVPAEFVIQGDIVGPLIFFRMGEKGASVVHSSGVCKNGNAIILAGRSATGKTTLALSLVQRGYELLGDNFVILRQGQVLAYPSLVGLFHYNLVPWLGERLGTSKRCELALKQALYWTTRGYIKIFTCVNPREVAGDCLAKKATLSRIVLLLPGRQLRTSDVSKEDMVRHLVLNQQMDFPRFTEYALAYAYEFPDSNLARCWNTYERNLIENIPHGVALHKAEVPPDCSDQVLDEIEALIDS